MVNVLPAPPPEGGNLEISGGDSILLTADGENIHWFDAAIGGNLLQTGPSFQTPALNSSTTYYIESHHQFPGQIQTGGKPDTSGQGGLPSQTGYLIFDAWQPFTLISVMVYVPPGAPAGIRFVQLLSGDSILASKSFPVQTGYNKLDLNFSVPVGTFSLRSPQGNLFRNYGKLSYPYPIGDAGQIITSSFGNDYYYFFYDWEIKTLDYECISDRIPLTVLITGSENPTANQLWSITPNPSHGEISISFDRSVTGKIGIYNTTGSEVWHQVFNEKQYLQPNLSNLPAGIYSLRLVVDGHMQTKKIVLY